MKNKDLIAILASLSPEEEIGVEVIDIHTGNHLAETYDIGYDLAKQGKLKLQVAVETATNNV